MTKQRIHLSPSQAELIQLFWAAPDEAFLDHKTAGLCVALASLDVYASTGGGPAFIKRGRNIFYRKSDVLIWHEAKAKRVTSTSELNAA